MTAGNITGDGCLGGEPRLVRTARADSPTYPSARTGPIAGALPAVVRGALLPACDGVAIAVGALLTAVVLAPWPGWPAVGYAAAVLLTLAGTGRHRLRICLRVSDEIAGLVIGAAVPVLPILLLEPSAAPAGTVARLAAASAGLLVAMRAGLYAVLRAVHRRHRLVEPALIVGTGTLGAEVGELLQEHTELGLRPVGFVDTLPPGPTSTLPLLGELSELSAVVARHGVRRVIVCFPADSDADLVTALRGGRSLPAEVYVVPRMYELGAAIPTRCRDEVWGIPLVPLRRFSFGRAGWLAKRGFDLLAGSVLLLLLTPLMLGLMAAVSLSGVHPVLFRQTRLSRSGRLVGITKLRTVSHRDSDTQWSVASEHCSALGRWLRATHLDELPQLINVVRGDMSLVGPRPERPYFAAQFAEVVPRYADRHRMPGGMTGWAQVHGLYGDTPISERVRFDNHYIEHWSPWLDLIILARTLAAPLTGSYREHRSRGGRS